MSAKPTWKKLHLDLLKYIYGSPRRLAEYEQCNDDRRVYFNMYHNIVEAIESLPDEPHNLVCVAMNDKIDEYRKAMDEIKEHFDNKEGK